MLTGCPVYDPPSGGLSIKNMTTETIFLYLTCEDSLSLDYPLRLYYERGNEYDAEGNSLRGQRFYLNNRIEPGSFGLLDVGGTPINPKIFCKKEGMYLFFITESVMQKHKWEEIVAAQRYQKKMQFTQKKWIV